MNKKFLRFLTFFVIIFTAFNTPLAPTALAGGGSITPINFAHAQQITGKTFSPVVAIKDPASNYNSPWVGQNFTFQAHSDLAGASCTTTQATTDSQGHVKADCKADAYGKFVFSMIEGSTGQNQGSFEVYFTESGSGFSNQGSTGVYTVSILPSSISTSAGGEFALGAQLKRNGETVPNYNDVEFFRWDVLEGSVVVKSANEPKNRSMSFMATDKPKTTVRVVALMNDGSQAESGAITILSKRQELAPVPAKTQAPTTTTPAAASSAPTQNPTNSPSPTPKAASKKVIGTPTPAPTPTASASAQPAPEQADNAALAEEVKQLQAQVAEQQEQLNVLQRVVKNLREMISNLFW